MRLFSSSVQERKMLSFTFRIHHNFAADNPNNFIFVDDRVSHRPLKRFTLFSSCSIFWAKHMVYFLIFGHRTTHNSRFKQLLLRIQKLCLTAQSLNLGSLQRTVPERTSFLSPWFVSNSIHLVMICLFFFSFKNDHLILTT